MKQKILLTLILFILILIQITNAQVSEETCDAKTPCKEGMECISFPSIGLRCAHSNPCSYFKCPEGTQCIVAESYPAQLICSRPCKGEECTLASKTVSYNVVTKTVVDVTEPNGQTASHDISLWRTTDENKGILETSTISATYQGKVIVKNSKLYMTISSAEKPINILPDDASNKAKGIAETPEIKKVELKAETEKPVYSVIGTKQARILFIIPVSMDVETKIDADTGSVISVNKPWWNFLVW
jgi:hypothetical protein